MPEITKVQEISREGLLKFECTVCFLIFILYLGWFILDTAFHKPRQFEALCVDYKSVHLA